MTIPDEHHEVEVELLDLVAQLKVWRHITGEPLTHEELLDPSEEWEIGQCLDVVHGVPKCFNWFRFLIYLRYIRETLATFLCCLYCGLCESLVRSLRRFPSHKLRVFKEKIFLHLDDHSSCCH